LNRFKVRFAMSGTIRTFFSFDIEDQAIIRRLKEVQGMLLNSGADLKSVEPQNIHLTIRFLGEISPNMVDPIHEEMKQLSFSHFTVELRGLGAFPKPNYPRVVWAGIRKGADEIKDVFGQLEPRLRGLGFKPDSKGFSPHLTIARVRTGRNKAQLAKLLQELEDYEFGAIKAECLRLKKSDLTHRGPIYSTLREVCGS
jgi:2'-5' RNA ligase